MVSLEMTSACAGLLPVTKGTLALREAEDLSLHCVMPFKGQVAALQAGGFVLPRQGQQSAQGNGLLRWFGKDTYLCLGGALPDGIETKAAVSDQTDAWARMILEGPDAEAVLARLVPVDLRVSVFGVDQTCRSLLGHMNASVTRIGAQAFEIMVFRSMAKTAVHELADAMGHVTARSSH